MTVNLRYHLLIGRGYARTIGELAESLSLPRRVIEEAVQQSRLDGIPIVSGSEGLWIAASATEAREASEALRRRAITQLLTARALRRSAERMEAPGQIPLPLGRVA